jgi:transposase
MAKKTFVLKKRRIYKKPSDLERAKIVAFDEIGKSKSEISRLMKIPRETIRSIISSCKATGDIKRRVGSGRRRKTSKREDNLILRMSKADPFMPSEEISKNMLLDHQVAISRRTVDSRLSEAGLDSYVSRKKPFISDVNKKKRLEWCIAHKYWTTDDWKRVLWTDESPFTLSYHGRVFVRRPKGTAYDEKYIKPTFKHGGGKIQVWGCFCAAGVGDLHRINGIMVNICFCIFFF